MFRVATQSRETPMGFTDMLGKSSVGGARVGSKVAGLLTGQFPARGSAKEVVASLAGCAGSSQEVCKTSRVEPGRTRRCSKCHGSDWVGPRGFQVSRVGSAHPDRDLIVVARSDPAREEPWRLAPGKIVLLILAASRGVVDLYPQRGIHL